MEITTMSALEAKNKFGYLLDTAQAHPVTIKKHGRKVAVMLSEQEYQRLQALEEAAWEAAAISSEKNQGYLSEKKSDQLLSDILNAKD